VSLEPGLRPISAVEKARADAQRQARSLSGGLVMITAVGIAIVAVVLFTVMDYHLDQDPHRMVKIAAGAALFASIFARPMVGLFAVPLLAPFILWLPKLPIPGLNTLNMLMGSVFFSFALTRVLQRRELFRNGQVGRCLLAMLALSALWIFRGAAFPTGYDYNAPQAGLDLFRLAMTFSVYFVTLAMVRGERSRQALAWAVVLAVLAESLVTIKMGRDFRGRAGGSIGQPNDLGAFLAMFTAFTAALFFGIRNLWGRMVLGLTVLGGCVGVVLTVSRGGLLALGAALGMVAVRSSRVLTVLMVVAVLTSPAWAPDYLKDRILGTQISSETSDQVELESSSAERVETWRTIGGLLMSHPIEGVGFAGLNSVLATISVTQSLDIKDSAHNTYLRMVGEMGLFGLGLFLWTLWTCWKVGEACHRHGRTPFDRQLGMGFTAAVLALAISCMFGDRFAQVTIGGNFWVAAALVTDALNDTREPRA
jgi:O-antigen ligase